MVLAHHLIWVAYGWWLPNDPRGSTSNHIASDVLADLGTLHFGRRKVQPASRDIRSFYEKAREVLQFPLLTFQRLEVEGIVRAFADVTRMWRTTRLRQDWRLSTIRLSFPTTTGPCEEE